MKIETLQVLTVIGGLGAGAFGGLWVGLGVSFVIYCIIGAIIPVQK